MAIIKIKKRENPFVQIDKTGIRDENLSWKATGLLTYLVALPEDWKINLKHLSTQKTDKIDSTKTALKELRQFNYCHFFKIREKGKIVETFYMVYEVPTPYTDELLQEIISEYEDIGNYVISYEPVRKREKKPQVENPLMDKTQQNWAFSPQVEKPFMEKPQMENPTLLIYNNTNKEDINNSSIKKAENNKIEIYDFLDKKNYSKLTGITKSNIRKNIKDLNENKFKKCYEAILEFEKNSECDFNAILYKALRDGWNYKKMKKENKEAYQFLDDSSYSKLDDLTKLKIRQQIKNLDETKFKEIYNLTLEHENELELDFNTTLLSVLKGKYKFYDKKERTKEINTGLDIKKDLSSTPEFKEKIKTLKSLVLKATNCNPDMLDKLIIKKYYKDIDIDKLIDKIMSSNFLSGKLDNKPNLNIFINSRNIMKIIAGVYDYLDKEDNEQIVDLKTIEDLPKEKIEWLKYFHYSSEAEKLEVANLINTISIDKLDKKKSYFSRLYMWEFVPALKKLVKGDI